MDMRRISLPGWPGSLKVTSWRPGPTEVLRKEIRHENFYFVRRAGLLVPASDARPGCHQHQQSVNGTWITQLTDANGNVSLFEVGTYSPDGSYTGANVNPSHTAHKGVWVRIGDRKFAQTILFFTHDATGAFNGIVKARIYVTLAEDRQSYDSVAERTVMDTAGNVLSVTPGIVGHSVRMNVELPSAPPPQ